MSELFATGRVVDLILAIMVVEAVALAIYRRRTGRGIATVDLVISLLGGVFLLLALRAALTGAGWTAVVPWLAPAGVAHLIDVWRRGKWRHS